MTDNPLRIGIIGAGRMGVTHQCIISSRPDVKVVAIVDPSVVVTKMMTKYAGVRAYKDYSSMLQKEALDAVLVCTPPAANHEILSAVAESKLHAFVEKPFTLSAGSGRELAGMFAARGLVTQVGYINRFNDVFMKVRSFLDDGLIGNVVRFRSEMFSSTVIRDPGEKGWRTTHANGGGAVYEMASHAIDLIHYLIGKPDYVGGTCMSKVFSRNVEDIVSSSFAYKSGTMGSIYVNWSDPTFRKPTNKFEIFGEHGKIQADQHGMKVYLNRASAAHGLNAGWNQLYITDLFNPAPFYLRGVEFTAQIYDFVDHVKRGDTNTRCSFSDGADALSIIETMFADFENTRKAIA
ncbi:MAG: Gfo/Idh/MocA family protein [Brevundimonas sp.]|jgi:predicted dehydrogenase|uniref:Gfo/Idh/MocA family protein n=1 Tax=Brevundimonas sp. TaxID=1871086 RepID=UPI004034354A